MRLPLAPAAQERLFQIIDALDALGCRCVLVGGLVPPLLLEALDPEGFAEASDPRVTSTGDRKSDPHSGHISLARLVSYAWHSDQTRTV
ncbi:MAG TPA: hypothetical protein PKU97_09230 [Kofleriaceae bacterium]|nr:hypothetical protein [Kofleriaceae bacterium]